MFPKNKIRPLQASLKDLGLYDGKIDGIIGPKTLAAIDALEKFAMEKPKETEPQAEPLPAPELDGPGSDISEALPFTLKNEGGFSNHPSDKGGPTKKGITIHRLSEYLGRKATINDVKNLSDETIELIYKKYYWDVMNLDKVIDQSIATALFDMGVLNGTGTIAKMAQGILGVEQDGKFGPVTLGALNQMSDEKFIPLFVAALNRRFDGIVANNQSQSVFLKGWKNRSARLTTLINEDNALEKIPVSIIPEVMEDNIRDKIIKKNPFINVKALDAALKFKDHKKVLNKNYIIVVDFTLHNSEERFYLINMKTGECRKTWCAHGSGSDTNKNGHAEKFSNVSGSGTSSLGAMVMAENYVSGKRKTGANSAFQISRRIDGLEPRNSNVRSRAIVFHDGFYVSPERAKSKTVGRSLGCFVLYYPVIKEINPLVAGCLIYAHHDTLK